MIIIGLIIWMEYFSLLGGIEKLILIEYLGVLLVVEVDMLFYGILKVMMVVKW